MSLLGPLNRRHLALLSLSAGLLAFQIALLQLLASSQWHHFAALVISVALLGFGSAGTVLALARERMVRGQGSLLPLLLAAAAACLATAPWLTRALFGGFDSLLLFVDAGELLRLAAAALLLTSPFFFGALAIGLVFTVETARIGGYYFANLLGSGFGCLLALAGLSLLPPERLPPLAGLLALAAAAALLPGAGRWARRAALAALALVALAQLHPEPLPLSQYKDLSRALALPGAAVVARRPSAAGQVHVVSAPVLRSAPGVSLNWSGALPPGLAAFVNGDLVGGLPPPPGTADPRDASTQALPYALRTPRRVLVLDPGTGAGVAQALAQGAAAVVAAAPHATLTATLAEVAPERFGRLLADPRVRWQNTAPRTWLARDRQSYDLVVLPGVGGFGGDAGLFALDEQPLLTREALRQAWHRLSPQGVLSVTAWLDYPVRAPLRLLATLVETLAAEGIAEPHRHIAAVRSWGTITFCLQRAPLADAELQSVRAFGARWAFDPLLLPDLAAQERQRYNRLQDDALFTLCDALVTGDREALYRAYPFRIRPATDDRPFFSRFLRLERLESVAGLYGLRGLPFLELGPLISAAAALVLTGLAALLIALPLARMPEQRRRGWRPLLYFGGLGFGYMWAELALIHGFVFYLGQPVYAATLVVGVLLTGSSVGSALTGRHLALRPRRRAALVAAALALCALLLTPLLQATLPLPLPGRVGIALLLLFPLAVAMGMPFPLGLRLLDSSHPAAVPWAWGINGCCSVAGAAMATLGAAEFGYGPLLLLAACAYLAPAGVRLDSG